MKNKITCTRCAGSGHDKAHKWPDGSFASCEACEGYGTAAPLQIGERVKYAHPTIAMTHGRIVYYHGRHSAKNPRVRFVTGWGVTCPAAKLIRLTPEECAELPEPALIERDLVPRFKGLAKHRRGGWEFYPVPAQPNGNFTEDLKAIAGLLGSILYETKTRDGAHYVRRIS